MEATCQRCHETLHHGDRYCPSCGLPQLIYVPEETPVVMLGEERGGEAAFAGVGPTGPGDGIAWRPAMRAAILLAIPAAVLSYSLTPIGLIWMMGAAAWAVSLYARRTRGGWPSVGVGARIGMITGLFAGWLTLCLVGLDLWVSRFVMHKGSEWDSSWLAQVQQSFERNQQIASQAGLSTAQAAQFVQMLQFYRDNMLSVEGRAGWVLSGLLFLAVVLVVFATIGGAVGARWLVRRPRRSA